jgi:hypothetical protein
MKYRELAKYISNLSAEQQDTDVTVFVSGNDEFYALAEHNPVAEQHGNDVLDDQHPYLVI